MINESQQKNSNLPQIGTKLPLFQYQLSKIDHFSKNENDGKKRILELKFKSVVMIGLSFINRKNYFNFVKNQVETSCTLILCPVRICTQWKQEIEKFTDMKSYILDSKKPKPFSYLDLKNYDFIICSHEDFPYYNQNEKSLQLLYQNYIDKKRGKKEKKIEDFLEKGLCFKSIIFQRVIEDLKEKDIQIECKIHYYTITSLGSETFLENLEREELKSLYPKDFYQESNIYLEFSEKEKEIYQKYMDRYGPIDVLDHELDFYNNFTRLILFPFDEHLAPNHSLSKFGNSFTIIKNYLFREYPKFIKTHFTLKQDQENQIREALEEIKTNPYCNICQESAIDRVCILSCMHYFCCECFQNWEKQQKTSCPICRRFSQPNFELLLQKEKTKVSLDGEITPISSLNIQEMYGTKIAGLIDFLRSKLTENENRLLIYVNSIDESVKLQNILFKEKISFLSFLKSDSRMALSKFKKGISKILILIWDEIEGLNLQFVNYLVFLRHSYGSLCESRDHIIIKYLLKIGREKELNVVRILIKGSCEEDIYDKISNQRNFLKRKLDETLNDDNTKKLKENQ